MKCENAQGCLHGGHLWKGERIFGFHKLWRTFLGRLSNDHVLRKSSPLLRLFIRHFCNYSILKRTWNIVTCFISCELNSWYSVWRCGACMSRGAPGWNRRSGITTATNPVLWWSQFNFTTRSSSDTGECSRNVTFFMPMLDFRYKWSSADTDCSLSESLTHWIIWAPLS